MRIRINITKSIHENAARYYEDAKEARKKIEGLEQAIKETEGELEKVRKAGVEKKEVRVQRKREWFEKFNWFNTSGGKLAVGGRNAQQNDQVFGSYMEGSDLFFHADIQGGSAIILKNGAEADEQELRETAQFAASYSKAWRNANAAVDVYAVKKEQVSKHAAGGFIPTGAFAIIGKRIWFRGTPLAVRVGKSETGLEIVPDCSKKKLEGEARLVPAKTGKEKGALAKELAKRFQAHPDELLELLPNGKTKISKS
ncbi:MAG: NFACT RNA binding domain-containing protein [Candidatus Micrarchaeota archaeon]